MVVASFSQVIAYKHHVSNRNVKMLFHMAEAVCFINSLSRHINGRGPAGENFKLRNEPLQYGDHRKALRSIGVPCGFKRKRSLAAVGSKGNLRRPVFNQFAIYLLREHKTNFSKHLPKSFKNAAFVLIREDLGIHVLPSRLPIPIERGMGE